MNAGSHRLYQQLSAEERVIHDLYKANSPFAKEQCFTDYLNDSLRAGKALTPPWNDAAEKLDRIIRQGRAPTKTILFRATFDNFVVPFIRNAVYEYPAFMSTTTDEAKLERHWSGINPSPAVKMRIECPAGTYMAPMETNADFGGHEGEMLLGRNAVYHLVRWGQVTDSTAIADVMGGYYAAGRKVLYEYDLEFVRYIS